MNPAPHRTRRAFILNGVKAGTLVALFPLAPLAGKANAACSFAYGSGLYGRACFAGTLPKLLQLPPAQGRIQQDGFRFFLQGEPNHSYAIQFSADLTNWTPLGTLTMPANGSPTEILDTQTAAAPRRFYRAIPL
jgi:hypothetical protein